MAFLYTNNELSERETKKTIPFTIEEKNKVPKNKFNQGGKGSLPRKLQNLEEIEEDIHKWKHILYSWTRRINIIKLLIPPKVIYRFNAIIKILMAYFTDLEQVFQTFI